MVVIYDDDGKAAPAIGNAFVEKGIDNTYVVTGGFLGLCSACPDVLVGEAPTEVELSRLMSRAGLRPSGSSVSSAMSSRCSTAASVRTSASRLTSIAGGASPSWK